MCKQRIHGDPGNATWPKQLADVLGQGNKSNACVHSSLYLFARRADGQEICRNSRIKDAVRQCAEGGSGESPAQDNKNQFTRLCRVRLLGPVIAAGFVLSIIEDNGALPRRGPKRTRGL